MDDNRLGAIGRFHFHIGAQLLALSCLLPVGAHAVESGLDRWIPRFAAISEQCTRSAPVLRNSYLFSRSCPCHLPVLGHLQPQSLILPIGLAVLHFTRALSS